MDLQEAIKTKLKIRNKKIEIRNRNMSYWNLYNSFIYFFSFITFYTHEFSPHDFKFCNNRFLFYQ